MLFVKKREKIIIVEPLRDDISKTNMLLHFWQEHLQLRRKIKKN